MANKNAVKRELFLAIAARLNVPVTSQSWFKLGFEDATRHVYVSKSKAVKAVHLSGFTHPLGVEIPEADRPTGRVHQELNFAQPVPKILADFVTILREGLISPAACTADIASSRGGRVASMTTEQIAASVDAVLAALDEEEQEEQK